MRVSAQSVDIQKRGSVLSSTDDLVKPQRIGIYSGTFDPVHVGHVAFALQAIQVAGLDVVYFMPERRPRRKGGVTHYGHRVAMLKKVVRPHAKLEVLETVDAQFSVRRTLPYLRQQFGDAELVFLLGSDAVTYLPKWEHVGQLAKTVGFCIGLREGGDDTESRTVLASLNVPKERTWLVKSFAPSVSSTKVRQAIQTSQRIHGMLESVYKYAKKEWLYL